MSAIGTDVLNRFGLTADPFLEEHDPHFLLRSKPLLKALESLHLHVGEDANLIIVVAAPGLGKTALIDAISREFKDGVRAAKISHPAGSWADVSQQIGTQLRLPGGRLTPGAMAAEPGHVQTYRVILNHAEELSNESVKHIGAYLDLEAEPGKMVHRIQVIAMAQEKLETPLGSWLQRRAHPRIDLDLLDDDQTGRYVERRVQLAQTEKRQIFTGDALVRISELAGGNPGLINRLCRAALEVAAVRGKTEVDAETVGTAGLRLHPGSSPSRRVDTPAAKSTPIGSVAITRSRVASPPATPKPTPKPTSRAVPPASASSDAAAPAAAPSFFDDVVSEPPVRHKVEILESEMSESKNRSQTVWVTICALLLGVIAGGVGFLSIMEPPPAPEPVTRIVEVPVPVEVEKIVEVPVEVVKIVRVEVPKAKPRPPKPQPVKVAKVVKPPPPARLAPAPKVAPKKPGLGPIPPAAEVLDRAFAKSRPGDHSRTMKILEHGKDGAQLTQTLKLARTKQNSRTLTVGVLTGDVSSDPNEVESRFLSIETGGPEDERFGFRPARGEVEQLKGGGKSDPFHGSSFQYDDFRVRSSDQFLIHGIKRSRVESEYFYVVSVKPRYKARYEKIEYVIDAMDYALVEVHFFRGVGLRPYRILQYPRAHMEEMDGALVAMRIVSRDFENSRIDEARVEAISIDQPMDRKLFTLSRMQDEGFEIPGL